MTSSDQPLWRQITDTLRDEIAGGLAPGTRLPTEAQLARRFAVNRHTVRRALAALAEEGQVHARRGAGVFVMAPPMDYPLTRHTRFTAALAASGRVPGRTIVMVQPGPASVAEAEALTLDADAPVLRVEGTSLSDGVTVSHFRSAFPLARLPGLEAAFAEGMGVTQALAACGVAEYTRAWTRLSARLADSLLAGHLQIRPGGAVIRSESLNQGPDGEPVEYGITHFAGDRVTLTVMPE
ncbi:MAG: phosphonate metabolism transcriptional regulator PhnF [Pararhodobacter sp.]|nr:phosphonate metabolism transcriptional regulator PhnF [Pararhodobacter sp.]